MLSLADLRGLTGGRVGVVDVACPCCGPSRAHAYNRTRKTLRLWNDGRFITFHCERCGKSGWSIDGSSDHSECRAVKPVATEPASDKSATARFLWDRAVPAQGTIVERYLRSRGCWVASPNIRFLAPRGGHGPAMIARFGAGEITGTHLTRLAPDGSGKACAETAKITLGPSIGQPIVVADNPERGELVVAEGIEDAASLALATRGGWTCWAAGAAGRIPQLMAATKSFDRVMIAVDNDFAGRRAFQLAKEARPDAIALNFGAADANDVLREDGTSAILTAIDRAIIPALQLSRAREAAA